MALVPREQRAQARALAGPEWLGADRRAGPLALVGDFNATPLSAAYRTLASRLIDARRAAPFARASPTFPSRMPLLAIDHVFFSAGVKVRAARTALDPLSRSASDHVPLVVDFYLEPGAP